ncbi:error-prone DNA polymerase [Oligoflexia bacterium]|nr:error-prone DNA polymerase [Oligoflexia bacterium]
MESGPNYAELQTTSNFSFLRGASHPEEYVYYAAQLGYQALALTDYNTLAGIVRGHVAAKKVGIQFIVGCRLELCKAYPEEPRVGEHTAPYIALLVYPTDLASYAQLTTLLTLGKRRSTKGGCLITLDDFLQHCANLAIVAVPTFTGRQLAPRFMPICRTILDRTDPKLFSIACSKTFDHNGFQQTRVVLQTAKALQAPLLATNNVYYHAPNRKPLQDVLTCIRHKTTVAQAGYRLLQNAERHLKPPAELHRLFREHPAALQRTLELAELTSAFSLDQLKYEYPSEICPKECSALTYLTRLTWEGAHERYPDGIPNKIVKLIQEELRLIHELAYEKYFLTCYDIVCFAKGRDILCQGRGAAANSAVCFCLGITAVDPEKIDLLFARFVSKERAEPPDIDIDFEHERREEVIQYIYQKYGRERAALTCEVVTYRHKSAIRDVGKALGLSLETVNALSKALHRWTGNQLKKQDLIELGLDPNDITIRNTILLSTELRTFPRHLSQHVGGFIISEQPLSKIVPILNAAMAQRTIVEWDKDDIEALGMLKIDILALGIMSCIRKALALINQDRATLKRSPLQLHSIPSEDAAVYDMLCASDTIGVFQVESRAQMSMLPRLKPRCFYDLVIEVALVRPGPIQGNMVHPFLQRRSGKEKPFYPDQRVKDVLGKTLGIPIFQEQAMRLAIVLAGFSAGEAEKLRRTMAAWKKNNALVVEFKERIVAGMRKNGYTEAFALNCVNQLKGFSEYGFPESHAASFALLVYASAWIKKYYPAIFAAALINSQPMGFYAPAQIIADARQHGVRIKAIDINYSAWDCTVCRDQNTWTLQLGLRLVRGLSAAQADLIIEAVKQYGRFASIQTLWNRVHSQSLRGNTRLKKQTLYLMAKADAFRSMNLERREAIWKIRALPKAPLPLDPCSDRQDRNDRFIKELPRQQSMFKDYDTTGFSLKGHPLEFIRNVLDTQAVYTVAALKTHKIQGGNHTVAVAGMVLFKQRPPSAKGVVFITLEDETGIVNLILRPHVFDQCQKIILSSAYILARGELERVGTVVYILTERIEALDVQLGV